MTAPNEYISGFTEMDFSVFSEDARNDEAVAFQDLIQEAVRYGSDFRVGVRYERKSEIVIAPVTSQSSYRSNYDDLVVFFTIPQSMDVSQKIDAKAVEVHEAAQERAKEAQRRELLAQRAQIDAQLAAL